jgi:hypothetical protein
VCREVGGAKTRMVRIFRDIYLDCCRRRKDAGGLSQKQISGTGTGRNAWENRGRLSTGCQRAPCRAVCTACAVFFVSPQRVHVSRPARPCAPRPDSCTPHISLPAMLIARAGCKGAAEAGAQRGEGAQGREEPARGQQGRDDPHLPDLPPAVRACRSPSSVSLAG